MGIFDDMKTKGKDLMDDPDHKAKIEKIAEDKGMSIEDAKAHYIKHKDNA